MQRAAPLILTLAAALVLATPALAGDITRHDRQVIKFFQHHPRLARTPAGGAALLAVLPHVVRALQASSYWPPHHRLWDCIAQYEAAKYPDGQPNWQGVSAGGMGFHYNWGYGLAGNAGAYSQHDQEWAAERGYAASGYSYHFLYQQWYEWDGAAGCGTTG